MVVDERLVHARRVVAAAFVDAAWRFLVGMGLVCSVYKS